jgi:hypothetical protein
MRLAAAAAALWVATIPACDSVFDLEHVEYVAGRDANVSGCWASERTGDEDGDGYVDGCDPCPADPTAVSDSDADGVADACDPDDLPTQVVEFDGFTVPLAWELVNGASWVADNGNYEVSTAGQSFTELGIELADHPRVDAIVSTTGTAGVYMLVGPSLVQAACSFEPNDQLALRFAQATDVATLPAAGTGRLRMGIDADDSLYCFGERSGASATVRITANPAGTTTTRIGLVGTMSTFHSVAVFGRR